MLCVERSQESSGGVWKCIKRHWWRPVWKGGYAAQAWVAPSPVPGVVQHETRPKSHARPPEERSDRFDLENQWIDGVSTLKDKHFRPREWHAECLAPRKVVKQVQTSQSNEDDRPRVEKAIGKDHILVEIYLKQVRCPPEATDQSQKTGRDRWASLEPVKGCERNQNEAGACCE